jgi:cyclopropane fatty-acyl-phospholipid synthase-like methyltransferase
MYTTDELKKIYENRYESTFRKKNTREILLYSKYAEMLLPSINFLENRSILDLGCGVGHKTVGFCNKAKRALAIDLSENAIIACNEIYNGSNIIFKSMNAKEIVGEFDVISAFGFSLFNVKDTNEFVDNVLFFISKNLKKNDGDLMLIGSFTDFSGKGENSWYLHTKQDLAEIKFKIENSIQSKVTFIFPHKLVSNYFGYGLINFIAELKKLIIKRKKTFFIRIEYGQK